MNTQLNILTQDVVNQIAAGEVIERPSSVVKELVDNSIDAQANHITIKVGEGGIESIEVSDNGMGIPKENLHDIFLPHSTTKLSSLEDLNNLLSMGFRGEALSTILAVSKVDVISKYVDEDFANNIVFEDDGKYKISKAPRESGTQTRVSKLFYNVPARAKFLKTARTEYTKIVDTLFPYFLFYNNISWELYKDGKKVIDLSNTEERKDRVKELIKQDFTERMFEVFYEGNGMKIEGLVAHPSDHFSRTKHQYIFINGRNIWDNGIAKAVTSGYDRFIPHGQRVPFILLITINPELVDVNVHPRKEEVRFLNPYRIFSAVTDAVTSSLVKSTSYKTPTNTFDFNIPKSKEYVPSSSRDITFSNKQNSVRDSMNFSKAILQEEITTQERSDIRSIFQVFNKYIIIEFEHELWIIDQHAAAERVTFEKLTQSMDKKNSDVQNYLVPVEIEISEAEKEFLNENISFFKNIGFEIDLKDSKLLVRAIPVEFSGSDIKKLFTESLAMREDISQDFDKAKSDMIATMACHTSIRSAQKLDYSIMNKLYNDLIECDNPYSCPHGRPIVFKQTIEQLDKNFDRTY